MSSFLKATQTHANILKKDWTVHEPNSETIWHSDDNASAFEMQKNGTQIRTNHVVQDYDWTNHHFTYKWNNLGLRGPDPNYNADKRMLIIGSSLTIGQGVPVEDCFVDLTAKELGYDYINLSEFYVLTDGIKRAVELCKAYKPHLVVISNTRHLYSSEFILKNLFRSIKNEDKKDIVNQLWGVFLSEAKKQIYMFEQAIIGACNDDTKLLWFGVTETNDRKMKLGELITQEDAYEYSTAKRVTFDSKEYVIDLGRDNKHPGLKSNINIKNLLVDTIRKL